MKLFIPSTGTELILSKDWDFSLYRESRNESFGILFSEDFMSRPNLVYDTEMPKKSFQEVEQKARDNYAFWKNSKSAWKNYWTDWPTEGETLESYIPRYQSSYADKRSEFVEKWGDRDVFEKVTLPAGTKLIVDRIYIRNGASDYDSLSFRVENKSLFKGRKRFWAKLKEVNQIEFNLEPSK